MFSDERELSFNDVPKAVAHLIGKVDKIETLLSAKQPQAQEGDQWLNLNDLCKSLVLIELSHFLQYFTSFFTPTLFSGTVHF